MNGLDFISSHEIQEDRSPFTSFSPVFLSGRMTRKSEEKLRLEANIHRV